MKRTIVAITVMLLEVMGTLQARATEPNWTCNPSDYQYDMTVYCILTVEGERMSPTDYKLAAFCENECRGIAEVLDYGTGNCYYLRVRSNKAAGEQISFKVYDKSIEEELTTSNLRTTLDFENQARIGYPSEPVKIVYTEGIMGDLNHDNKVSVSDVVLLVNYILGIQYDIDLSVADLNGDGQYSVSDVVEIVEIILNN